ncbi:MAG: HAD hydrolase-like protein [Candidatus Roizmanbacteria bacterium]|nr:MAG: HAD hydrolase-like protein [Candidatus Roizmanbacteria bacterium]
MPEKYIITQDTVGLFSQINKGLDLSKDGFSNAVRVYFDEVETALSQFLNPSVEVARFYEEEMESRLREKVEPILKRDSDTICVCLDRFLLGSLEKEKEYEDRFFRFSLCRSIDGQRVPRQGNESFESQIAKLRIKIPDISQKKVLLVDDGLFSGGTVEEFLRLASDNGIKLNVGKVIGFIGNMSVPMDKFDADIAEPIDNLYEWIDIRDFSPLGGKKLASSKTNKVTTSVPYLYPWSDGCGASLDQNPGFFDASQQMIKSFSQLVKAYEISTGSNGLTFKELVKAGFPLPTNISKTIPVSINERVTDYLDRCLRIVKEEQERKVAIFDMDGTLYQLDGVNNGFQGSKLEKEILRNAKAFIIMTEVCDEESAEMILRQGLNDPIGISRYLANRYGITRSDYFNVVWDIDPEGIVQNFETAVNTIRQLQEKNPKRKLVLLTSAPRIWAQQVLKFLRVKDCFESLYTGEQYGRKDEIFLILAGRYQPENIISIGDQVTTDIDPAQQLGMETLLVKDPKDLELLIR